MKRKGINQLVLIGILAVYSVNLHAQAVNREGRDSVYSTEAVVKTNLLYDLTTTLNLGMEFRLGRHFTFDLPFNYNPWVFSGDKKLKHWLIQPELRYWVNQSFQGSFWGLHFHGAQFNTAHIFDDYQYEGWLAGAGISYGYRWALSDRWGMEATIGAGYAHIEYDKYTAGSYNEEAGCNTCGYKLASENKNYWGPTKIGLSLTYTLGRKVKKSNYPQIETIEIIRPIIQTDTVYLPQSGKAAIRQEKGEAVILFPLDQYVLLPDWEYNPQELAKIRRSMDVVREHPGAEIQKILIEAYASPEGELQHNIFLSEKRAAALRDYMAATYGLDINCFSVRSKGENWEGLREAVNSTSHLTATEKRDITAILAVQDLAERKTRLKSYKEGTIYSYLLREIYPNLRVSEYRIDYIIKEINN